MPVNTMNEAARAMLPVWTKCRDVYAGQEKLHAVARREEYLPRFADEEDADYNARVKRAEFFNAFFRTVQGLVGMLFLVPPKFEVSAKAAGMLTDVTQTGMSLADLSKAVAIQALTVGRIGLLVDYPRNDGGMVTVAQAERAGLRPKMATYMAESIMDWDHRWIDGRNTLSQLVLAEQVTERDPDDRFAKKKVDQMRVLELDENGELFVEVWRANEKGVWEVADGPFYPQMASTRMREIPFVCISADDTSIEVDLPPLIDLVNMNVSHYQSTADAEHGAHKTAMPQPWITGIESGPGPDGSPAPRFYIGGGVWTLPQGCEVGMLEYSGQGLAAIEARIKSKEEQMAVLGARMLEAQKRAAETAEAAGLHRSGEQSALTTAAESIDAGMARALGWFDKWAGGTGQVSFALNKDFIPTKLTPEQLRELVAAWMNGALSDQELYSELQGGGIVDADKPFEEHEAQVQASAPKVAPVAAPAPAGADVE